MITLNVVFSINSKIIESEYQVLGDVAFARSKRELSFTLEEYTEYLNIILNNTISRSGGRATTPFKLSDTPVSNSLSIAMTSVGKYVDTNREMIFIPVSNVKDFSISEEKFTAISMSVLSAEKKLSVVSRVPGPRSSDLKDVMTSRVENNVVMSINDAISPTAITNCALVQPTLDKSIAYSIQQSVETETINYQSKLIRE